jgi:hypothetical protein
MLKFKFDILVESILLEADASRQREGETQEQRTFRQEKGQKVEDEFRNIMENKGYIVNVASQQDERRGIDFFVFEGKRESGTGKLIPAWMKLPENVRAGRNSGAVETKGNKVINGNLLVELINEGYYKGWLFGQANYISFQDGDHLQFVRLHALREMMKSKFNQVVPRGGTMDILQLLDGPNTSKYFPIVRNPAEAIFPKIFRRPSHQKGKMDAITRVPWEEVLHFAGSELRFKR